MYVHGRYKVVRETLMQQQFKVDTNAKSYVRALAWAVA